MLPVIWLEEAEKDLEEILSNLADYDATAAYNLNDTVQQAALKLHQDYRLYPAGPVANTKKRVIGSFYMLIYRVTDIEVEIVNVVHTRRRYP